MLLAGQPAPSVPASAPIPTPEGRAGELSKVTYRVKAGDTLSSIARAFRTTVDRIRSWNDLRGDRIVVGDRLTIYTSRGTGSLPRP